MLVSRIWNHFLLSGFHRIFFTLLLAGFSLLSVKCARRFLFVWFEVIALHILFLSSFLSNKFFQVKQLVFFLLICLIIAFLLTFGPCLLNLPLLFRRTGLSKSAGLNTCSHWLFDVCVDYCVHVLDVVIGFSSSTTEKHVAPHGSLSMRDIGIQNCNIPIKYSCNNRYRGLELLIYANVWRNLSDVIFHGWS